MDEPLKKKFKFEKNDINHELEVLQEHLLQNCLCSLSENVGRLFRRFHSADVLWPQLTKNWNTDQILMLITCVQLICEKTMKQSANGFVCSRIADVHNAIIRKDNTLIDYFIELVQDSDQFVSFAACRVLTLLILVGKTHLEQRWLDKLTDNLEDSTQPLKISFSLEVLKRIIEWKDFDEHVLEDELPEDDLPSLTCHTLAIRCEHFNCTLVKSFCIESLESKWERIEGRFYNLIKQEDVSAYEPAIVMFLKLWEAIISVKANLSINDTEPFYLHLEKYVSLLSDSRWPTSPIIWEHILNLFNEVLCYGSTLALQQKLADEPCLLANQVVYNVKNLLRNVPYQDGIGGFSGVSVEGDRILLKKLVLMILKAVAVFVKDIKYDPASDSSSDSSFVWEIEDEDTNVAAIREHIHNDVLCPLDEFIKNTYQHFLPEYVLAKWIVKLFSDQDDYLVESTICCLDMARTLCYRNSYVPNVPRNNVLRNLRAFLNPTQTFLEFLDIVSFDKSVLLDFLVSNETSFLLYILRFLKYIRDHWEDFKITCGPEIYRVMKLLRDLRKSLERLVSKDLFPYNINPVLSLLTECDKKCSTSEL